MKNDRNVYLDAHHSNQIKREKKGLAKVFLKREWLHSRFQRDEEKVLPGS